MSDTNKKNYTVNDLMGEFFPSDKPDKTDSADIETEEISAYGELPDDAEMENDTLEDDPSEAYGADITIAGKSEWESLEVAETVSEIFDSSCISETEEADFPDSGAICGDSGKTGENAGNEAEMQKETEISRISEAEAEVNANNGNDPETDGVNDIDNEFSEGFFKRLLKAILPWKGDSAGEVVRKIIFIAAVLVFIGAGCMLVSTLVQSKQAVEEKEKDKEIIVTTAQTIIDSDGNIVEVAPTEEEKAEHRFSVAEYYKNINKDYVGYLELSGCDIADPVVKGEDNEYYLTHSVRGGTNKAGAIFMDYRCTFSDDYISPNIVLYGHNQEDLTMFGSLKNYKQNVEFYSENPLVRFSTESASYEYLIYGFFVTNALEKQDSNGVVFHYQDYIETMADEATFDWYMDMVYERNQIISPVDVEYGDKLLCLSTCSNEFSNSRFVIFARMLREGETADDYDFSETCLNPYARGVDWEAIMSGETSAAEDEFLDEDDDSGEITGNGFLETAVHSTRRPAETAETSEPAETEVTTVPGNPGEETAESTSKKKKKTETETEETTQNGDSETSGLEAVTRKKSKNTETSVTSETEDISENGETVTRQAKPKKKKPAGTDTPPAETAPPTEPEDGSSETVTAG